MPKPPAAAPWNELGLSEDPAVELLQHFGYTYVSADELDKERASALDVVLVTRLEAALKRLNPWLNDGNLQRAVREVTHVAAASLLDANEQL